MEMRRKIEMSNMLIEKERKRKGYEFLSVCYNER
jgi:hypothetical protein